MKKIIACVIVATLLSGCGDNSRADIVPSSNILPNMTKYSFVGSGYHYLVDNRTGVVYLELRTGHSYGITVMLNADGTPVTKDQLELE